MIIPAFNEADSLPGVLAELAKHNPDHDLVVVDDGSTDDTAVVARAAGATCLRLPFNLGIGSALRLGFRYAVEQDYDRAYQFDADGQHDASQVGALLAGLADADMVIGSRFTGERGYRVGRSRGMELFATEYPAEYMEAVEALVLAVRRGFTVREVPVVMHDRAGGRASNRNLRLAYHFVRLLIVLVAGGTDRGRVRRLAS